MGHGDRLPRLLGAAVRVYLEKSAHVHKARQLGISRMTWWRWRRRPDFLLAVAMELNRRQALAA